MPGPGKFYLCFFGTFWNLGVCGVFSIKAGWICACESKGYDRLPTVQDLSVKATTDWNRPLSPGLLVTTCMSYLTTGAPGKERGTNKLPLTGRIQERSKAEKRCQSICPTNLPEFFLPHPSWLSNACNTKKDPKSERLAKDNPETNHHKTWDCKPHGRVVLLSSFILLLSTQVSLSNKDSCFVSTCVYSDNSLLDKSLLSSLEGVSFPAI